MKIGILTVHRATNVGAVLQTYALQELLRSLGHNVKIINYVQKDVEQKDRSIWGFKKWWDFLIHFHPRTILCFHHRRSIIYKYRALFDRFITKYLNLTVLCDATSIPKDEFDVYVIGSDQLWNRDIFFGNNDPVFWGNFNHAAKSRIFAYAVSTTVKNLSTNDQCYIRNSIRNFSGVSFREKEVADYVNQTYNISLPAQLVLDPTLVVDKKVWDDIRTHRYGKEKYIFVYEARPYSPNSGLLMEKAQKMASKIGCSVKTLKIEQISDFVDLIADAQYVISSSFHGIVFSINYNKPLLAVSYGDDQDNRYKSLLKLLNGEQMLIDIQDDFIFRDVDYAPVNAALEMWKKRSIEFLKQI